MTTSQDCDSEDTTKTSTSQKGGLGFRSSLRRGVYLEGIADLVSNALVRATVDGQNPA